MTRALAHIGIHIYTSRFRPLPQNDFIVDATAGHELLSFMDAFSGYNQIIMDPTNQGNTSSVTGQGTYYYQVMPFGLKNTGPCVVIVNLLGRVLYLG